MKKKFEKKIEKSNFEHSNSLYFTVLYRQNKVIK